MVFAVQATITAAVAPATLWKMPWACSRRTSRPSLEQILGKRDQALSREDVDLVNIAHCNGVRLLKLVNSLLDYSRIEAGKAQVALQKLNLPRMVAEIAAAFEPAIKQAGLE